MSKILDIHTIATSGPLERLRKGQWRTPGLSVPQAEMLPAPQRCCFPSKPTGVSVKGHCCLSPVQAASPEVTMVLPAQLLWLVLPALPPHFQKRGAKGNTFGCSECEVAFVLPSAALPSLVTWGFLIFPEQLLDATPLGAPALKRPHPFPFSRIHTKAGD